MTRIDYAFEARDERYPPLFDQVWPLLYIAFYLISVQLVGSYPPLAFVCVCLVARPSYGVIHTTLLGYLAGILTYLALAAIGLQHL